MDLFDLCTVFEPVSLGGKKEMQKQRNCNFGQIVENESGPLYKV
jgi:hypothetical protein